MKKILTIIAVLLISLSAFARNISKSEALKLASEFFDNTSVSNLEVVWTGGSSENPSFYAINNSNGGFVIISGSDNINPVLGYAYDRHFKVDNMPSNVEVWFDSLEESIKEIEQKDIRIPDSERGMFNRVTPRTKGLNSARLLTTAEWGQGSPYNADCNLGDGTLGVTGCVATAMAITLRYHQHPEKGIGKLEGYTTGGYKISGYSLENHKYDWANMPLTDAAVQSGTTYQKGQIAQLMHDCGVMVHMQYSPKSSGAYSFDILPALVEHMGYDQSARFVHREVYATSEWVNLIKSSISDSCPVVYGSQSSKGGGGHQFVIDGFDNNDLFHVNWGWGGSDNGYFVIELPVGSYVFNSDSDALLNLRPKSGDNIHPSEILLEEIVVTKGDICKDSDFSIHFGVGNWSMYNFPTFIQLAIADKEGKIKHVLGEKSEVTLNSYYIRYFNCSIQLPTRPDPTDKLVVTYVDEKGKTRILPYYHNGYSPSGLIFQPYTFIKVNPDGYKAGDYLDFEFLTNKELTSSEWKFDGTPVNTNYVILTSGKHTVEACFTDKDGNSETVFQEITVK